MKGPIKKPDQIEFWIQYLQQFTYIATRYSIEAIYNSIKPGHEFSTLLEDYVFEGGLNFELFRDELKEKMAQSISPNIILTHVGKEIEPTIQLYKNWYQNNESEIDKFNQYNPYKILLVLVKDTENEIMKYSPKVVKSTKSKKQTTFEGLFRDRHNAKIVKQRFELSEYTINGEWHGLTEERGELLTAFYVLKPILKQISKTAGANIFYSEFGLPVNHISDRHKRNEPLNDKRKEFENLFADILEPKKR